jgi:hypothetical protein
MALVNKSGVVVPSGALAAWIQTLPEPTKSQYEELRQAGVAAGHNTEGFKRIFHEFCVVNELVDNESTSTPQ